MWEVKKIAIITSKTIGLNSYEDQTDIIASITEWTEVSDDDYNKLVRDQAQVGDYHILVFPEEQEKFIKTRVEAFLERAKQREEERAKREALKAKKAAARAADELYKKQKLFEQLKKELSASSASKS